MKKSFALAALALLVAGAAQAQTTASITATALVAGPLSVVANQNLDFGTVIPGTPRTIDPLLSASAGRFTLTGGANAQVQLTWTFPAGNVLSDGATHTMPVTFTPVYNTVSTQATATALITPVDANRRLSGAGDAYIWVGGTVTPGAGQFVATYNGTVQLDVAYTGN